MKKTMKLLDGFGNTWILLIKNSLNMSFILLLATVESLSSASST